MEFYKRKKGLDQYFTSDKLANHLVDLAGKYIKHNSNIIEPSAGNGQILKALKRKAYNKKHKIISIEIDPALAKISNSICEDYLKWFPEKKEPHNFIVIGNPPFSIPGSRFVVQKFINHSLLFANTIIFIVPLCMSVARNTQRVNEYGQLVENVFFQPREQIFLTKDKKKKKVKVAIQVWQKNLKPRLKMKFLHSTIDFDIPFTTRKKFNEYKKKPDILVRAKGCLYDVGQLIFAKNLDAELFENELKKIKKAEGYDIYTFFIVAKDKSKIPILIQNIKNRKNDYYSYLKDSSTGNMYSLNIKEFISIYTYGVKPYSTNVTKTIVD